MPAASQPSLASYVAPHLNLKVHTALYDNAEQWLDDWDIRNDKALDKARELFYAAPGGVRTTSLSPSPTAGSPWIPTKPMAASTMQSTLSPPTAAS